MDRLGPTKSRLFLLVVVSVLAVLGLPTKDAGARPSSPGVARPSFVYPPDRAKWFPLRIPGSRAVKGAGGAIAQIVELRGWLTFVGPRCYSERTNVPRQKLNRREPDWHYNLELDPVWLDNLGVHDPNVIVRPGNVINWATRVPQPGDVVGHETGRLATPSAWGITARPIVHVEVTSWDPSRHRGQRPPAGWHTYALPGCALDVRWPYDPRKPMPGQAPLKAGQYVRMVGSLVTDDPHVRITEEAADYAATDRDVHGILGGDDATTLSVRLFWEHERFQNDPANASRWTELHPPDTVEVLRSRPRTEVLRSVLVATPPDLAPGAVYTLDVNLPLPEPAVPGATPRVVEIIGPDTQPRSLHGTSAPPPARRVTITSAGVQLHINVARHGTTTTPSAFQAAYRISH